MESRTGGPGNEGVITAQAKVLLLTKANDIARGKDVGLALDVDLYHRVPGYPGFILKESFIDGAEIFDVEFPEGNPFAPDTGTRA
jgi:hypothetical protein